MLKELEEQYPEYITTGVIAHYCGVSRVTVLRWIEKGIWPHSGFQRVITGYVEATLVNSWQSTAYQFASKFLMTVRGSS